MSGKFSVYDFLYPEEMYPVIYDKGIKEYPSSPPQKGWSPIKINPSYWLRHTRGSWKDFDYSCAAYLNVRPNNGGIGAFLPPPPTDCHFRHTTDVGNSFRSSEYASTHKLEYCRNRDTDQLVVPDDQAFNEYNFAPQHADKVGQQAFWMPGAVCAWAFGPRHIMLGGIEGVSVIDREGWASKVYKECYFITRTGEWISRRFKALCADRDRQGLALGFENPGSWFLEMEDGEDDFPETISFLRTFDRDNTTHPGDRELAGICNTTVGIRGPVLVNWISGEASGTASMLSAAQKSAVGGRLSATVFQNQKVAPSASYGMQGTSGYTLMMKGDNNESVIGPGPGCCPTDLIYPVIADYAANGTNAVLKAAAQASLARKVTDLSTLAKYLPILNHPDSPKGPVLSSKGVIKDLLCEVTATSGSTSSRVVKTVPITTSVEDTTFTATFGDRTIRQFEADNKFYVGSDAASIVGAGTHWPNSIIPNQGAITNDAFLKKVNFKYKRSSSTLFEQNGESIPSLLISSNADIDTITAGDVIEVTTTFRMPGRNSDTTSVTTATAVNKVAPTGISYSGFSGTTAAGGSITFTVNYSNTPDPPPVLNFTTIAGGQLCPTSYNSATRVATISFSSSFTGESGDAIIIGITANLPHNGTSYPSISSTLP